MYNNTDLIIPVVERVTTSRTHQKNQCTTQWPHHLWRVDGHSTTSCSHTTATVSSQHCCLLPLSTIGTDCRYWEIIVTQLSTSYIVKNILQQWTTPQQCDSPKQLTQLLTRDDLFPLMQLLTCTMVRKENIPFTGRWLLFNSSEEHNSVVFLLTFLRLVYIIHQLMCHYFICCMRLSVHSSFSQL